MTAFAYLRVHTEYNFFRSFGKVDDVVAHLKPHATVAAITDGGTWGHIPWSAACRDAGLQPIFGVEVLTVPYPVKREASYGARVVLLARNPEGLRELYHLMTLANSEEQFYRVPRLGWTQLRKASKNLLILIGQVPQVQLSLIPRTPTTFLMVAPGEHAWIKYCRDHAGSLTTVVVPDNLYPAIHDKQPYEIAMPPYARTMSSGPRHLPSPDEFALLMPGMPEEWALNTARVAAMCELFDVSQAIMIKWQGKETLRQKCVRSARWKPVKSDPEYQARLDRELSLIAEKQFDDYFHIIADMVAHAKRQMLVGPARGSAAGSLVCFLLGITDIDPLRFGLLFERFIDVTRKDLPDIDLDFPDVRRNEVFDYVKSKYGAERVARLGTVLRYAVKSILRDAGKVLQIPWSEMETFSSAIVERSSGDARAALNLQDAFESLDVGKAIVEKYPKLRVAQQLEGHAKTHGKHAAGIVITEHPIQDIATVDREGAAQIDKYSAEKIGLLKIDVLGLRTLTILQDVLDQKGFDRQWLLDYPLDDQKAFDLINREQFSGIFQFEGYALRSLTRQMKIREFNDIVAITALARPGPLHSGASNEFVSRRTGQEAVVPIHPLVEDLVAETQGLVVYQEQVMSIGRRIGLLSWEHVSELRKAMSKSLGEEFFNRFWEMFETGAAQQGIESKQARIIWDRMCTFGSWAFNKSHAVSYGLISYWCAVLKANYPLEFALASLRHESNEKTILSLLRELVSELSITFIAVDPASSEADWSIRDGKLYGGLRNIKGLGPKKIEQLVALRASGKPLPPGLAKLIANPVTPYDRLFEAKERWGRLYKHPERFNITSGKPVQIKTIRRTGDYLFIGKIVERKLRDLNEYQNVVRRGGKELTHHTEFLNLILEDDSGSIIAKIDRWGYPKWGKPIIEGATEGDWFLWRGRIQDEQFPIVYINKWRQLTRLGEMLPGVLKETVPNGS